MGKEEQNRANFEGDLFIIVPEAIIRTPEYRAMAYDTSVEYITNHPGRILGRFGTASLLTYLATKGAGFWGFALGTVMNIATISGDIRYGIEDGIKTTEEYIAQAIGGHR